MQRFIVLDTETTGFSPGNGDKVIEIGCVEIIDRKITNNFFCCFTCTKKAHNFKF